MPDSRGAVQLVAASAASALVGAALACHVVSRRVRGACCAEHEIVRDGTEGPGDEGARDPCDPRPRQGYLSWDDYFMAVAMLSSQRSKDPAKQVGACIVDEMQIICGIGYNGFPRGCSDADFPWRKQAASGEALDTKYPYVCHAEMNALLNKNGASVKGARIFVTMFPCNECAKLLIQAGIREIVFHESKDGPGMRRAGGASSDLSRSQQYEASRRMLRVAGVSLRQHRFARPVTLRLTNAF